MQSAYCLFCISRYTDDVVRRLDGLGYESVSPLLVCDVFKAGSYVREKRALLPGYVFFYTDLQQPNWREISKIANVIRPLEYCDGCRTLRGEDLRFAFWIRSHGGLIEISKALRVGTKISIISGPLKEYEGFIMEVNKKRRVAAVQIGLDGQIKKVWMAFECIDEADMPYRIVT